MPVNASKVKTNKIYILIYANPQIHNKINFDRTNILAYCHDPISHNFIIINPLLGCDVIRTRK